LRLEAYAAKKKPGRVANPLWKTFVSEKVDGVELTLNAKNWERLAVGIRLLVCSAPARCGSRRNRCRHLIGAGDDLQSVLETTVQFSKSRRR